MQFEAQVNSLKRFQKVLPVLVHGIPVSDLTWKPSSGNWSIQEIVCHLADEEQLDFPMRLRKMFDDPNQPWPPVDPDQTAIDRNYIALDFQSELDRFLQLRDQSLAWIVEQTPNWDVIYRHPKRDLLAGDIFSSWIAHDLLHLRQITKRLYEINQRDSFPYDTAYAGDWTA